MFGGLVVSKTMPKELNQEIRNTLETLIKGKPGTRILLTAGRSAEERDAIVYLTDIRALVNEGHSVRVSAYGREYLERLNTPAALYWFNRNWFPAVVAASVFLASVGGIIATILTRQPPV